MQIVQSMRKSDMSKIVDSLSNSHQSNTMQAVTYQQMNSIQSFVATFIEEAKRVEQVVVDLVHKKEKEIAAFKQRVIRKQRSQNLSGNSIKQEKYAKDEFERATSWGRAFSNYYSELKWLNAFASLNRIAMNHVLIRMAKNYLVISDNLIEKQLLLRCKLKYCPMLYQQSNVKILNLQNELLFQYADLFTGGNIKMAQKVMIPQ